MAQSTEIASGTTSAFSDTITLVEGEKRTVTATRDLNPGEIVSLYISADEGSTFRKLTGAENSHGEVLNANRNACVITGAVTFRLYRPATDGTAYAVVVE